MYRQATDRLAPEITERDASCEEWVDDHYALVDQYTIRTARCPEHGETADASLCVPLSTAAFCGACFAELERHPVQSACEWTRTDQQMADEERHEAELMAKGKL